MLDLLFFLILGHYLGDFALQSDTIAREKGGSRKILSLHVAFYTVVIAALLFIGLYFNHQLDEFFTYYTPIVLIAIYIEHWLQDYVKSTRFNGSKQGFYFDQGLHVAVMYLVRLFIYNG